EPDRLVPRQRRETDERTEDQQVAWERNRGELRWKRGLLRNRGALRWKSGLVRMPVYDIFAGRPRRRMSRTGIEIGGHLAHEAADEQAGAQDDRGEDDRRIGLDRSQDE